MHHANEARFEKWYLGRRGLSSLGGGGEALYELFVSFHISLSEVYSVMTTEFILAMKIQ